MKIREQSVHHLEGITWSDEQPGITLPRLDFTGRCGRFECAQRSRAHSHHSRATRTRASDRIDSRRRHIKPLTMHLMLTCIGHAHGLERTRTHVQRHPCEVRAACAQGIQHGFVKMQARGRCGDRAGNARIHGLITRFVFRIRTMRNVRRQRYAAMRLQYFVNVSVTFKAQLEKFALPPHYGGAHITKDKHAAGTRRLTRAHLRQRTSGCKHAFNQRFHRTTGILASSQARFDHAGIVKHQHIARINQRGQIAYRAIMQLSRHAIQMQHAARAALRRRRLCDQPRRQIKIKFIDMHRTNYTAAYRKSQRNYLI